MDLRICDRIVGGGRRGKGGGGGDPLVASYDMPAEQ